MNASGIFATVGGRRYVLAWAVLIAATGLVLLDKMGDAIWRDTILGVVAVYVAGNTVQKLKATTKEEADA